MANDRVKLTADKLFDPGEKGLLAGRHFFARHRARTIV
jgi:hypothetical protein